MVGILTFHRAINYGALLQTYALHKALNDLDVSNCVIDYKCQHFEKEYHLLTDYKYCGNIKGKIVRTLNMPNVLAKRAKFKTFIKKNITLSTRTALTRKMLLKDWRAANCDIIITGSDQVWHNGVTNFDKTYFLDFVSEPQRKKSYAASFGFNEIPQDLLSEYKKLLNNFGAISVREKNGADIIKMLLDRDVPVVLDPTLLLEREQWKALASGTLKIANYILVFCIVATESIMSYAEELKRKTGCKIIVINDKTRTSWTAFKGLGIGPQEFLDLFINARYIITNSYHGTAFSINLNKDFYVELQSYTKNTNNRILQLIDLFGLHDRVINKDTIPTQLEVVQYDTVNAILLKERHRSISFLKEFASADTLVKTDSHS